MPYTPRKLSRAQLDTIWVTGFTPTQYDFEDLFESFYNIVTDTVSAAFATRAASADYATVAASALVGPGPKGDPGPQGQVGPVGVQGPAGPAGGGGGSLIRYSVGNNSYIVATSAGVGISKTNNNIILTNSGTGTIVSSSLYLSATDMAGQTSCTIDFGINIGAGDNSSYTTVSCPQFQVFADVAGSRAFKSTAQAHLNASSHTLTIAGLTTSQGIWISLAF